MSYGPKQEEYFPRAIQIADRILRGDRVADLPLERPTKFEFVLNLNTAKALGISIPPSLLARADEVIE
jgi:putative ABC transport system substrate-binding protein